MVLKFEGKDIHKFLIGMHIRSGICFLSDAERSISDKALFKESGVIQSLKIDDLILAERGFNIAVICNEIACTVIVPPFLSGLQQFTLCKLSSLTLDPSLGYVGPQAVLKMVIQDICCFAT